jgi:hypothetical protein
MRQSNCDFLFAGGTLRGFVPRSLRVAPTEPQRIFAIRLARSSRDCGWLLAISYRLSGEFLSADSRQT